MWSGRDEGGSDENKEGQSPFGLCYKPFTRNGKDAQRTSEDYILPPSLILLQSTNPTQRVAKIRRRTDKYVHDTVIAFFSEFLKICHKDWAKCAVRTGEDDNYLPASSSHSATVYKYLARRRTYKDITG